MELRREVSGGLQFLTGLQATQPRLPDGLGWHLGAGLLHSRQPGLHACVLCLGTNREEAASLPTGEKAPPPISGAWTAFPHPSPGTGSPQGAHQ